MALDHLYTWKNWPFSPFVKVGFSLSHFHNFDTLETRFSHWRMWYIWAKTSLRSPRQTKGEINQVSVLWIIEPMHQNHSTETNHINRPDFGELASQNEREITNRWNKKQQKQQHSVLNFDLSCTQTLVLAALLSCLLLYLRLYPFFSFFSFCWFDIHCRETKTDQLKSLCSIYAYTVDKTGK